VCSYRPAAELGDESRGMRGVRRKGCRSKLCECEGGEVEDGGE
jgi:hypothetical protein